MRSATPRPPPKLWVATHRGAAARLEGQQELVQPLPAAPVEPGEGLVEQQQPGLGQEHARQPEPALHAGRERAHALVRDRVELHLGQRGAEPGRRGVTAAHRLPEAQVLARGQVLVDVGAVRDHADAAARTRSGSRRASIAAHPERARRRAQERGEDAEQRGLAGAVGAEEGQALARGEREGHAVEHERWGRRSCGAPARRSCP